VVEEHPVDGQSVCSSTGTQHTGVPKEEIERIFNAMTLCDMNRPSTSSSTGRVSVGVNTGGSHHPSPVHMCLSPAMASFGTGSGHHGHHQLLGERDSLRLDTSGNLRRAKSWKK